MGSMLIGDMEDITRARRIRKLFGGALRQAGIVAAAVIYAIENNIARLHEDHNNAQQLAKGLAAMDGLHCDASLVESNLVFFEVSPELGTAVQFCGALKEQGVLIGPMGSQRMRAVTHMDVNSDEIIAALHAIRDCLSRGFSCSTEKVAGPYSR